jgi:large subunit ribosomal protein L4
MSKAIVIDDKVKELEKLDIPSAFGEINSHNFYLQVKSFLAGTRANTARAKTRAQVRGGGKKPWSQKGRGTARSGSRNSPIWVGGGKAFGPTKRNYFQKINKKQRKLAFNYVINEKASNDNLFVIDSLDIKSGKTKDANAFVSKFKNSKDVLIVVNLDSINEKTFLAFRNIPKVYLVDSKELNVYLLSAYQSVVFQKEIFENITKGD